MSDELLDILNHQKETAMSGKVNVVAEAMAWCRVDSSFNGQRWDNGSILADEVERLNGACASYQAQSVRDALNIERLEAREIEAGELLREFKEEVRISRYDGWDMREEPNAAPVARWLMHRANDFILQTRRHA